MSAGISRAVAQSLNPLVGLSAKDTYGLVAAAMRGLAASDGLNPIIVQHVADLGAMALEYEETEKGE